MSSPAAGDLQLREALAGDAWALAPLFDAYRRFYGQPRDLGGAHAFLKARLSAAESRVILAERGPAIVGFTQLYPVFSSVRMGRTFILNLFVAPQARRTGVAQALLAQAARLAERAGAIGLSLSTGSDNAAAQALYLAAGWTRAAGFDHFELALPARRAADETPQAGRSEGAPR